jgi:sugar phosphate isomerase/epimerase
MEIAFFCPRWGQSKLGWDDFAGKVKQWGYDGVETDLPESHEEREAMFNALDKNGLLFIGQHWETIEPDFELHAKQYAERIQRLADAKPLFINSQTGKDYFSFEQNEQLIHHASGIAAATGVPVYHETHRGKFSFAAHITKAYLQRLPQLEITLDISHWCAVAETFLHDQQEAVQLAISRTNHIHARVGFTQGPQVNDPRAPEWKEALEFHLRSWDAVVEQHRSKGTTMLTFTTEFGPYPYMPQNPYTQHPLADQWELNVHMKTLLTNRYW